MIERTARRFALVAVALLALAGCREEIAAPDPVKLTRAAIGNYCNMIVVDHPGPKAQVFERDRSEPIWFSSVRDGFAYLALPGEAQDVAAIYVHDMGRAASWDRPPDDGIWIKAETAHYVIESDRRGGMGAQETVPFADRAAAEAFRKKHGGRVVAYKDIPRDYIVGDANDRRDEDMRGSHTTHGHDHGK